MNSDVAIFLSDWTWPVQILTLISYVGFLIVYFAVDFKVDFEKLDSAKNSPFANSTNILTRIPNRQPFDIREIIEIISKSERRTASRNVPIWLGWVWGIYLFILLFSTMFFVTEDKSWGSSSGLVMPTALLAMAIGFFILMMKSGFMRPEKRAEAYYDNFWKIMLVLGWSPFDINSLEQQIADEIVAMDKKIEKANEKQFEIVKLLWIPIAVALFKWEAIDATFSNIFSWIKTLTGGKSFLDIATWVIIVLGLTLMLIMKLHGSLSKYRATPYSLRPIIQQKNEMVNVQRIVQKAATIKVETSDLKKFGDCK
jgi:hypothetical protein